MPEPTRRRHVVALSAAAAAVSLVLLITLVLPARLESPPPAAPAASASPGTRVIISSRAPVSHMRADLSRATVCLDGTRLDPPYFLSVDDITGRVFLGRYHEGTGDRIGVAVPVTFRFDARTGFMTVTCATDDLPGQWESDAR